MSELSSAPRSPGKHMSGNWGNDMVLGRQGNANQTGRRHSQPSLASGAMDSNFPGGQLAAMPTHLRLLILNRCSK